ncbi:MAG: hypothetical protein Q4G03_02565 [Planctomycetia bacterium]|nr:hypothetical protein [Planctomycetia bacterium]
MRRRAFTMLELLLVLALIFVIASISVTTYRRQLARAKFKSSVTQLQVDLHRARILAMRSGQPYIFRCAPNASVYEIAPLNTLQEAIYRMTDVEEFDPTDPLGGSLSDDSWFDYANALSDPGNGARVNALSDDLFAPENIQKDLQEAQKSISRAARLNALSGASDPSALGGSLTGALPGADANLYSSDYNSYNYSASAYAGADYSLQSDALGLGAQFDSPLGAMVDNPNLSNSVRDMNADERALASGDVLAWRVNNDGLIIRKAATDGVYFAFSRLSLSTPANLKQRRERGVVGQDDSQSSALDSAQADAVDLGSTLGGSLRRPPTAEDSNGLLGGALTVDSDLYDQAFGLGATDEDTTAYSVWSEPIVFYPNGKTSTAVIALASVGEFQYYAEIALRGMTGVAHVSQVRPTPPGENPVTSALSPEQLMAMLHPQMQTGYAQSDDVNATQGGALGITAESGGALGIDPNTPLGQDAALDPMANLDGSQDVTQPVYGSNQRSNYQFANPSSIDAQNITANNNANPLESNWTNSSIGMNPSSSTDSNAMLNGNLANGDVLNPAAGANPAIDALGGNASRTSLDYAGGDGTTIASPVPSGVVNANASPGLLNTGANDSNNRFSAGSSRVASSRSVGDAVVNGSANFTSPITNDALTNLDVDNSSAQSQNAGRMTRGVENSRRNGGEP